VANYFQKNGWVTDGPVLSEAVVKPETPVTADPANLKLNETIAGLKSKGVDFDNAKQPGTTPVLLVPAEQQTGTTYRVGFKNFEVITRYNRSARYAMAVHDLATSILERADATKLAAQPKTDAPAPR
jgi:membrane-bound lytic murein transglycosylase B